MENSVGSLIVAARQQVADDVIELRLVHPTGEPLPGWTPGAHVDVELGSGHSRQYSLHGRVDADDGWRISVLRDPRSRGGSQWIHDHVRVGDELVVIAVRNLFEFVPAERYVFIAGGIGITPLIPMVAEAEGRGAEWELHYGGRSRTSMAHLAELQRLYGHKVKPVAEAESGVLDIPAIVERPEGLLYCCGPEGLLRAVEGAVAHWPAGSLHVERFAAKAADPTEALGPIEVRLARSGLELSVPANLSILEAVRRAGLTVPSSCQEGICGSCETAVLSGRPLHRDSVLDEDERAANDTMMICVSRAQPGEVLELDL
jgi:ferredoxin-NADP reductase